MRTSAKCHFVRQRSAGPDLRLIVNLLRSGPSHLVAAAPRGCAKLSAQRDRRCKAAQGDAAYFVEHTSLKASTICSLYECLWISHAARLVNSCSSCVGTG